MTALLPRRSWPWTWPLAWSGAALALLAFVLAPAAWWWPLTARRGLGRVREPALPPHLHLVELEVLRAPPAIVATPAEPPQRRPPAVHVDPAWWTRGWNARLVPWAAATPPAVPDTLLPRPLLDLLGARAGLDLVLAQPDSAVEARLWWLAEEERLGRDDLDGVFSATARARALADLKSREAAIFDEFILETVPVPR
jgi:hypothetical protein